MLNHRRSRWPRVTRTRHTSWRDARRGGLIVVSLLVVGMLAAGFRSPSKASRPSANQPSLRILTIAAFTGPQSILGAGSFGITKMAVDEINRAGGVLGHKLVITTVDDRGDPTDGAVALRQALATYQDAVAVTGLVSLTAGTEIPLAVGAHLLTIGASGATAFAHPATTLHADAKYLYNVTPPDELSGIAMGVALRKLHLKRPALVFTSSPDALPVLQGAQTAIQHLGIRTAITLKLTPDSTSYGTEVQRLIASHPDSIVLEVDPQTAGTFFGNLSTALSGKIKLPMLTDGEALQTTWLNAVKSTAGLLPILAREMRIVQTPLGGPARNPEFTHMQKVWNSYKIGLPIGAPFTPLHDIVTLMALAMTKAHSTDPAVFAPDMYKLGSKRFVKPGTAKAYTYVQGLHFLASGKPFVYWGGVGPIDYNAQHVIVSSFTVLHWTPTPGGAKTVPPAVKITPAELSLAIR